MSTHDQSRRAHGLLDDIFSGYQPDEDELNHLRSFLPELPKQKTLEEIIAHVYEAWVAASGDDWGGDGDDPNVAIEDWLAELQVQLEGLNNIAEPTHPEFLGIEADYTNAPVGTVVARDNGLPWVKEKSNYWTRPDAAKSDYGMSLGSRRVLRWGWGNE